MTLTCTAASATRTAQTNFIDMSSSVRGSARTTSNEFHVPPLIYASINAYWCASRKLYKHLAICLIESTGVLEAILHVFRSLHATANHTGCPVFGDSYNRIAVSNLTGGSGYIWLSVDRATGQSAVEGVTPKYIDKIHKNGGLLDFYIM